jgi:hypothetical protein
MSEKYEIITLIGIALFGLIFKLFVPQKTSLDGLKGPADATIYGYSITLLSSIILLIYIHWFSSRETIQESLFKSTIRLLSNSIPALAFISILVIVIIINGSFKERINKGNVVSDYSKFQIISTFLIIGQFMIFVTYVYNMSKVVNQLNTDKGYESVLNKAINIFTKSLSAFNYLFTVINYTILGIIYSSLKFFSTDG